jgi:hypothetical protein
MKYIRNAKQAKEAQKRIKKAKEDSRKQLSNR